ncbi:terminase large subunit domain-containing protein [Segeticoccus rhizosphaerae]|uniref:terminase large subunit domain-containing protein n=1 Tax=Segeticoccus rhizosphaerae TaxID=1104777 RepID=UPI0010BFB658|nr:terminase large subunit [Ornithinicoccus soli]
MRAGPKAAVDPSPLPFRPRTTVPSERFEKFCTRFVVTPKGTGARKAMRLRPWQVELVASVFDAQPRPRSAGWMMPRGQGKSTLVAALGLFDLFLGEEGASVVVAATDERQAGIVFKTAARMVELSEDLSSRCQVFKGQLYIPERGATFQALPAEPKRLEGLDPTLAILDEIGVISPDVYEVVALAQGKRETSTLLGIGTPGPDPHTGVLADMRAYAASHPDDASFVWREFSADGFTDHPVECEHCWSLANPALDDFLHRDAMTALLPPKTREATFRRARLCQFVTDTTGGFLPPGVWEGLSTGEPIPDGADVVLALDGSFSDDTTALLLATVGTEPHFDTLQVWAPVDGERVPVAEVEQTIRDACRRWHVVEIIADPFRWTRTLQALEAEGLPIVEFPHSPSRLTAATGDLYSAAVNGRMTHSGEPTLAAHVAAAVVREDARGIRLDKSSRSRIARKIDLAACLVMAHSRATWRATRKSRKKTRSFAA